ncbi:MAG TPA: MBL fold metallo-hydrolase [Dehalococcoidia bacterium]|jgi:glyoxylase-like metal-dependent hydrolase (beta-lactamase superfamily II)|nr:MBL fold metallo-hydrolase [Dehalococcoidia bacterium]
MPVQVIKVGPLGPFGNNAYVIADEGTKQAILVDAPAESEKALDAAKPYDVRAVIVTHRHPDHWGDIDKVKERLGAPVYCHEADRQPYEPKVDGTVEDNQEITLGESVVRVLHTPGHTPGSICLLAPASGHNVLISGDTLFPGGPGRSDSNAALNEMIASIASRLLPLPENTVVMPGHGDDTTIAASKREYEVFASKEHPADLRGDVLWES